MVIAQQALIIQIFGIQAGQFATSAYGQISFKPGFQAKNAYQSNLGDPLVIAHGILFKFLWQ
jgi:hypothetical protein